MTTKEKANSFFDNRVQGYCEYGFMDASAIYWAIAQLAYDLFHGQPKDLTDRDILEDARSAESELHRYFGWGESVTDIQRLAQLRIYRTQIESVDVADDLYGRETIFFFVGHGGSYEKRKRKLGDHCCFVSKFLEMIGL